MELMSRASPAHQVRRCARTCYIASSCASLSQFLNSQPRTQPLLLMARAPAAGAAAAAAAARTGAAAGARGAATAAQRGKRELGAQPRSWRGAAAVIVVGDGGLRRWLLGTGTCWAEVAGSAPLRCSGGCTPAIGKRLCQPLYGNIHPHPFPSIGARAHAPWTCWGQIRGAAAACRRSPPGCWLSRLCWWSRQARAVHLHRGQVARLTRVAGRRTCGSVRRYYTCGCEARGAPAAGAEVWRTSDMSCWDGCASSSACALPPALPLWWPVQSLNANGIQCASVIELLQLPWYFQGQRHRPRKCTSRSALLCIPVHVTSSDGATRQQLARVAAPR